MRQPLNSHLQPLSAPVSSPPVRVAWKFGVEQSIQSKKIRSSTGVFQNLTIGTLGTANLMGGTVSQSLFENGTIANNIIQGGTLATFLIETSTFAGGTLSNALVGTSQIQGGTIASAIITAPAITGGTYTNLNLGGTAIYPVNAATVALSANNQFSFQTLAGSAILVVRSGGTNFYFTAAGTF